MNSFMSWVGGKKALRDEIVLRFPPTYSCYIEVFGGGGWVLFHKSPGKEMEVYNDFNPNLANLFRCVRDHPNELCDELRYTLNSRLDFDYLREMLHTKTELPDIRRAAYFYQIIRESYASGLDSFGAQPHSMWNNFPLIHDACGRLQKVVIENKDFEKLIKQYDRPEAFFYCDPPYYNTEDYYEDVGFTRADHERLANALLSINGFFLLSYNDCPEIRELYSKPGITIEGTTRLSNIAQRYEGGKITMEVKMEMHFELPENFAEAHGFGENSRFIARYDSIADKIVVTPVEEDDFDTEIEDAFDEGYDEGFDEGFYDGFYEGYRAGFDDSKNGEKYDPDKRFDEFDEESEETEDTGKENEPEYRKRSYLD